MSAEFYGASWGRQITADTSREGVVDDGNVAWEERVFQARQQRTQASRDDFEKVGKRRWRDRATGVEYRHAHGAPLQSIGTDATRNISCFFIEGGKLVFLRRADIPEGILVHHGEFYGAQVIDGQVIKAST
jgi:hypothetical protein